MNTQMQDAITCFNRDGYYIARGLLPASAPELLLIDLHQLTVQQLKQHQLPFSKENTAEAVHRDLKTLFDHDIKTYLATLSLSAKLTSFYEFGLHPTLKEFLNAFGIAKPVWQTGPVLHLMAPNLKVPEGYYGFGAHQDWPSLQGSLDGIGLWAPLVDIDRTMHTMEILPGSHKNGLYPATQIGPVSEIDPASYNAKDFVPLEAKRGDIVFMSTFMVHRSSTVGDERMRVALSIRYENSAELHYIARGYPQAQKRISENKLVTPDFPTLEQLKEVFK